MTLTSANAAVQILASAMKALNAAREHSKVSKDTDLKADINTLYDELLALKEAVVRVTDENTELRRALEEHVAKQTEVPLKPEVKQVGAVNYYFVGTQGPYCQPCYDVRESWLRSHRQKTGTRASVAVVFFVRNISTRRR